jgi:hypothetical protein
LLLSSLPPFPSFPYQTNPFSIAIYDVITNLDTPEAMICPWQATEERFVVCSRAPYKEDLLNSEDTSFLKTGGIN